MLMTLLACWRLDRTARWLMVLSLACSPALFCCTSGSGGYPADRVHSHAMAACGRMSRRSGPTMSPRSCLEGECFVMWSGT